MSPPYILHLIIMVCPLLMHRLKWHNSLRRVYFTTLADIQQGEMSNIVENALVA